MSTYEDFLKLHQQQLDLSQVPELFWQKIWEKLINQVFDAGLYFSIAQIDYEDTPRGPKDPVSKLFMSGEKGMSCKDPNNIFLIDHAWTYDVSTARIHLNKMPGLLDRMCTIMGNVLPSESKEDRVEFILREMWRYNQFLTVNSENIEERLPLWYIMDEVGSAINHSDSPNFRVIPFLHLTEGITYSLLFPVNDVDVNEEVTRDFIENQTNDSKLRKALLIPWIDADFSREDFLQTEPGDDYFMSGRREESLPVSRTPEKGIFNNYSNEKKLKVFTEYKYVRDYLTDSAFEITDNEEEADVLWYMDHFKDYETLSIKCPRVFVNQFPFESVLTVKDLLSIICRRKCGSEKYDSESLRTYPKWLPTTYNLSGELIKFVSYFQNREIKELDNHWICKPWNLARGLDIHPTNNLNHILRLPSTGPKVVQKYVSSPVLYDRPDVGKVKFDVRYVVLLSSVKPLQAYAYSNFFLRFANRPFALNYFDVYEQHFTVMNYSDVAPLHHVKCKDFVNEWSKMYPDYDWNRIVEPRILKMLGDVFEGACAEEPPRGIAHNPQSRAVYAVDLMLQWDESDIQPVLLEINFCPDNKRACEYYPEFYNDIFKCLFLGNENPSVFHNLSTLQFSDKHSDG
ncbi:tubulin--tyrosine ligase-like protein 12 [Fopius arisanus]|uniref:Tubulin--tyrosine ligase-like protein 12 n=1 Tax=Fopius arisanus TaxID=64838 RepID=A0A9R1T357_9HYME|nr:PREDICTED: tubulin--tyrosine ligase-like protein 12 [Fopius arisanus]